MLDLLENGFVSLEALGPILEERLSLAIWIWDLDTGEMNWSKGVFTLLGLRPGSIQPSFAALERMVHVDDRTQQGEIERALRQAVSIDRELRIIAPDGRVRWARVQIAPIMGASGATTKAIGVCTDVTSYHDKLHFHRTSGDRFNALCSAAETLIWTATPDGGAIELLNRSALSSNSVDLRRLMHPDDKPRFDELVTVNRQSRQPFRFVFHLRFPEDAYIAYLSRAIPVITDHGDVSEWVGVSFNLELSERSISATNRHLTGAQMRAARAILRWSVADLAAAAHISASVVRRLEEVDGTTPPELAHREIERALVGAGIEFTFPLAGKPGVRPR